MSTTSITPPPAAAQDAGARQPRPAAMRWALARVEGRRLLMHPLFMLAMVGAAILALGSGNGWKANVGGGADLMDLAGWGFVPASPVIFLVACLAASRARRDAAQDFHRPQPLAPRLRTQAALLSLGWAGLAAAALTAVATVAIAGSDLLLVVDAGRYRLQPWVLAQGPLYVVTIAAFGVLAGYLDQPRLPRRHRCADPVPAASALAVVDRARRRRAGGLRRLAGRRIRRLASRRPHRPHRARRRGGARTTRPACAHRAPGRRGPRRHDRWARAWPATGRGADVIASPRRRRRFALGSRPASA